MNFRLVSVAFALMVLVVIGLVPAPAQAATCNISIAVAVPNVTISGPCINTVHTSIPALASGLTIPVQSGVLPTITLPPIIKRATRTVQLPGPTHTATVTRPGPTHTATITRPGPTVIATKPILVPPVTVHTTLVIRSTDTVTAPVPRQPSPTHAKIGKGHNGQHGFFSPTINIGDHRITAGEVGLGLLGLIGIVALGLVLMYFGYYMGYKDSERKDTNFMRSLRDQMSIRR